ncbi:MAG: putative transcriptional regulator [Novosphingobium sp.]|nr:putative transcriptional regulator [Novosphingobium sp.]
MKAWDIQDHLRGGADCAAYINAALEDGDLDLIDAAIGDVARARGMSDMVCVTHEASRKSLAGRQFPLRMLLQVASELGLKVQVAPKHAIEHE